MHNNVVSFLERAFAVGYEIREPQDDAGYLPAIGEHVLVHTPEGKCLGVGEALRNDPTGPFVAVLLGSEQVMVHLADIKPAPWHGDAA